MRQGLGEDWSREPLSEAWGGKESVHDRAATRSTASDHSYGVPRIQSDELEVVTRYAEAVLG